MQRLVSTITQAALVAAVLLAVPLSAQNPAPSLRKANYPFGLKEASAETDAYLIAEYNDWWKHYVTSTGAGGAGRLRVQRDSVSNYDTVSEGQSYGMLLAVYFGDRTTFDALYRYEQEHCDPDTGLMHWMIRADGVPISEFRIPIVDLTALPAMVEQQHEPAFVYISDLLLPEEQKRYVARTDPVRKANPSLFLQANQYARGFSSATDADMDIAMALCFAHARWGSTGTINYLNEAVTNIMHIVDNDSANDTVGGVTHRYLRAGSEWGDRTSWNPSYFMPAWLRIFAKFINDNNAAATPIMGAPSDYVSKIVDLQATMYSEMQVVNANNGPTGLYPDWCDTSADAPTKAAASDRFYYLDDDKDGNIDVDAAGKHIRYSKASTADKLRVQSFNFYYDAVRVPWRVGLDYSLNGDSDALAINTEIGSFFKGKALTMVDGYSITGGKWVWTDRDGFNTGDGGQGHDSGAFVSMAATASMTLTDTANAAAYYAEVKKQKASYNDPKNPYHYFGNTLRLLSLLYMSGRMPDLTEPERPVLGVQFMTYNANPTTNTIFVNLRIINRGDVDVDLSKLAANYWFTADNNLVADVAEKDAAFVMNSGNPVNTKVEIMNLRRTPNRVERTSFPAGSRILTTGQFVELHLRIHKSNWTNYNQSNDYSFSANYNFADTKKITVYYDGTLVAGTEP